MGKIDKEKEVITFYKFVMGAIISIFIIVAGWLLTYLQIKGNILAIIASVFLFFLLVLFLFIIALVKKSLDRIEKL